MCVYACVFGVGDISRLGKIREALDFSMERKFQLFDLFWQNQDYSVCEILMGLFCSGGRAVSTYSNRPGEGCCGLRGLPGAASIAEPWQQL